MSNPLAHPSVDAVKSIQLEVLAAHGWSPGIRNEALLESAIAAPQANMMGQPLFTDPVDITAAYLFYLCRNRPFVDENKRTALAACLVFMSENSLLPEEQLDADASESFVLEVASSERDRDQTAAGLKILLL